MNTIFKLSFIFLYLLLINTSYSYAQFKCVDTIIHNKKNITCKIETCYNNERLYSVKKEVDQKIESFQRVIKSHSIYTKFYDDKKVSEKTTKSYKNIYFNEKKKNKRFPVIGKGASCKIVITYDENGKKEKKKSKKRYKIYRDLLG